MNELGLLDDEDKEAKKHERVIHGMIDSVLGGLGFGGNAVVAIKNTIMEYNKQRDKGIGGNTRPGSDKIYYGDKPIPSKK